MERLQSPWGRFTAYLEAYLADHGLLRKLYRNFYQVSEGVFRSNHPSPRFLRQLQKKHGIKTVVSLRRANKTGQYLFEKQACDELGITLINNHMSSRSLPKNHKIEKLIEVFEAAEKPLLIHCKSGADRAGLASVIYEYAINKKPIEEALKQLHWRFGHFRYADTGKLDFFFDNYLAFKKENPDVDLLEWMQNYYDREALDKTFKASGWANILVNTILRRE